MIVYKVHRPFLSYGMYHAIGEVIQDASLIDNFYVRLQDGTLEACDSTDIPDSTTEVKPTTTVVPEKVVTMDTVVKKPAVSNNVAGSKSVAPKASPKVAAHTTTVNKVSK